MMRITIVSDYAEPIGGVEIYNKILQTLLRRRGHTVQFIGGSTATTKYRQFFRSIYSSSYGQKIHDEIHQFSPDVVIAHSIYYNISPSFLPKIAKEYPIVHIVPNLSALKYTTRKEMPLRYLPLIWFRTYFHRYCLRRWVDIYIAPSETARSHLESELGIVNTVMIPFPIYWEIASKPVDPETPRILFVGRLDSEKGVDVLIRSLNWLSMDRKSYIVDIIGEGPIDSELSDLVTKLGLEHQVRFRGQIPHERLEEEFRNATAVVLPSTIEENSPLVIRESLSQGTPVITTNFGGQRELIENGECGLLVPPGNDRKLSLAIKQILDDEELRKQLSWNALEHSKNFSKEKYVQEFEKVLELVVNHQDNYIKNEEKTS